MQYSHGISASTGKPFSPPLSTRIIERPNANVAKGEKVNMMEGKCHRCKNWVKIEGVKNVVVKVSSVLLLVYPPSVGRRIDSAVI